jgi:NAD(P)-dependent dehydrogenase (short-subunit alcohol dehydrogenase family)
VSTFQDKAIIVTDPSLGIGKELTLMLLRQGAKVAACSRSEENLHALRESTNLCQDSLLTTSCNVSRHEGGGSPGRAKGSSLEGYTWGEIGEKHRWSLLSDISLEQD